MHELSREEIEYALGVARSRGFRHLKIAKGGVTFSAIVSDAEALEEEIDEVAPAAETPSTQYVKASLVGYFRTGKSKVEVGKEIEAGEVIGEIVALGIVNEVTSKVAGTVEEILVADGEVVDFGRQLIAIKSGS
jgi:acetyl-CoA carboxylase biotin carboxyl carrier protein